MGCQCSANTNDQIIDIDNIMNSEDESLPIVSSYPISDYTKKAYRLINKIRENPSSFAQVIENSVKFIQSEKGRLIFNHKLKVALHKGLEVFQEASNVLKKLSPMSKLNFKDEILVQCPEHESELKDINVFKEKILKKLETNKIDAYYKDAIKEPEISVLLMIVDDAEKNSGKKRNSILNPEFKNIAISSSNIGNTFCAYFTFSK